MERCGSEFAMDEPATDTPHLATESSDDKAPKESSEETNQSRTSPVRPSIAKARYSCCAVHIIRIVLVGVPDKIWGAQNVTVVFEGKDVTFAS